MSKIIHTVYRLEHIYSGLGPFRHGLSEKTKELLHEYWDEIPNVASKFPSPTEDSLIMEYKNKIPKGLDCKFACLKEEDLYEWLGIKVLESLKKEGFIIREYKKGIDYQFAILGTHQAVIFFNK